MGEKENPEKRQKGQIPLGQIFLDDMFLLLMAGLIMPFIIYLAWGYIDIGSVPPIPESHLAANAGSAAPIDGAKLVMSQGCTACHSSDGSALVGPTWKGLWGTTRPLTDGTSVMADEAYLRRSLLEPDAQIAQGFLPKVMPSFNGKFSEEELQAIFEYIKGLK